MINKLKVKRTRVASLLLFFFIVFTFIFSACVPNKRLVYLQHDQENKNKKEVYPTDTVLRTYNLKIKDYRLKPGDIVSIRVASITPEEFNFVRQYEQQLGQIRRLNQYQQGNMGQQNNQFMNQGLQRGGGGGIGNQQAGDAMISALLLDQMQSGFVIDPRGQLELPEIGIIDLTGLTLEEAEALIKNRLTGYFETPMVRMQLLSFHYTILGEVNQEGRYTSFNPRTNIFDAIMLAGNLSEFADRSRIKIVRYENEMAKVIYLNMLDEDLLAANNFFIQPDDLIIVPPLEARATRRYTLPSASTILGVTSTAISLILLIINLNN